MKSHSCAVNSQLRFSVAALQLVGICLRDFLEGSFDTWWSSLVFYLKVYAAGVML